MKSQRPHNPDRRRRARPGRSLLVPGPRAQARGGLRPRRPRSPTLQAAGRRRPRPPPTAGEQAKTDFPSQLPPADHARQGGPGRRRHAEPADRSCRRSRSAPTSTFADRITPRAAAPVHGAAPAAGAGDHGGAPPPEATAALLPIGATVGTAGLPVMPYTMEFEGGFFEIADFFGRDRRHGRPHGDSISVNGRLLTIDGFSFTAGPDGPARPDRDRHGDQLSDPGRPGHHRRRDARRARADDGDPARRRHRPSRADPAVSAAVGDAN